MLKEIFHKIEHEYNLNKENLVTLLSLENPDDLALLFSLADRCRRKYVGEDVHLRGLIEFSNYCRKNCHYCGIRRGNQKAQRYRMTKKEILITVSTAEKLGYKTVVLQSGEDTYFTIERMTDLIKEIKKQSDVALTLSIGERSNEDYQRMYQAGANRFLLRFETSNQDLYQKLHPDSNYEERMTILRRLKEIGYQVGSGIMVGIPGQTKEDLAADILKFKELELDMVGIGPYICHQNTPLVGSPNGTVEMTFKTIALTRIVTRTAYIPATTALATLSPKDGRKKALQLGANVVMPNVTPLKYQAFYDIYPAKEYSGEDAEQNYHKISKEILAMGRLISHDYGHSLMIP